MNYIGAYNHHAEDAIIVWERGEDGIRTHKAHYAPHYFYVPDEDGEFTSIYGDKLKKLTFETKDEFNAACRQHPRKFESDIPPLYKLLMEKYYDVPAPNVHYALFDIEVDYKQALGFSSPENPYAPLNAVTIWQSWTKQYLTYAVPPRNWDSTGFEAKIAALWEEHKLGFKPNVILCANEEELLRRSVNDIQDADIISGWNSEFFDLPYTMKRIERVSPKLADKLSFIGCKPPKESTVTRYGSPAIVYALNGRTHLDYLDLFRKFTFSGHTSYSLANIANEELEIPKLHYEGTLEQLYNRDFAHFIAYNARDVEVLVKLDQKFKFIALVNAMSHENTVLFQNMLGTVRYVETGITNRCHNIHNLIVADKRIMTDGVPVEGALVLSPRVGLHDWIGSVDINSLYPSVMRALNISPEKYVGQFSNGEADWHGILDMDECLHTMVDNFKESITLTGEEWWKTLVDNRWVITSYGTVFDESSGLGIVPEAIKFWYNERKRLQAEKKKWSSIEKELDKEAWQKLIAWSNQGGAARVEIINQFLIGRWDRFWDEAIFLQLIGEEQEAYISKHLRNDVEFFYEKICPYLLQQLLSARKEVEHYDLLQLTKKIQLNSTYGALLSEHFRFGRKEMGGSVTACGRQITTFMIENIGELVTGKKCTVSKHDHVDKDGAVSHIYRTDLDVILLSDTDSCYFKTNTTNKADAIEVADGVAEAVNELFPAFMRRSFNCQPGYDALIKAGREIVGSKGLFLNAKKKYTIKVVNLDGFDLDPPKLKTVGSEMKKADTPKVIQDFLKELMHIILDGGSYQKVEEFVNTQRGVLVRKVQDPIALGVSKQINNLDAKYTEYQRTEKIGNGKVNLPGHVRAAVNYNELVQELDPGAKLLRAGDKGLIFYLQPNERGLKTIAFPADTDRFPQWFLENFQIDKRLTETKMIDLKLERIFEALNWEIPTPQKTFVRTILKF